MFGELQCVWWGPARTIREVVVMTPEPVPVEHVSVRDEANGIGSSCRRSL